MILKVNDRIRNKKVEYFEDFNLSLRYDSVASTFSFQGIFDHESHEQKDLYCIGHYHIATLEHEGQLLLTGYILSESLKNSRVKSPVAVAGYSLPGVLEDCQVSVYPLNRENVTIKQLAEEYLKPFGLKIVIDPSVSAEMNANYKSTDCPPTHTIKAFLTELCSQKNIIITHDVHGRVVFTRAKTNVTPILNYGGEGLPCPEMNLTFNGQAMHSHIRVMKQAEKKGGNTGDVTIRNPYVPYVYRPRTVIQNSGDDIDTAAAARNILSEELKNIKLTFTTDRWLVDGKVIMPNNIITVLNPPIYLYKRSRWFIEQVDFKGNSKALTATITCVLPEVYNNETPFYMFAGINTH